MRPVSSSISCSMARKFGKHRHALGENGASGERQPILRQISGADALGPADRAIVEALGPSQNLQQRGFAGAVRAHQADPVARRNHPVGSFEQELVAIAFAGEESWIIGFNRLMREAI